MRRMHLLELHEQPWVPERIRNVFREALAGAQRLSGVYDGAAPRFAAWLDRVGADGVLDLCSGSGGPALALVQRMARDGRRVRIRLSDLYPDTERFTALSEASTGEVSFEPASLDATDSHRMDGYTARTIVTAFHHFEPQTAREILEDAARHSDGIAILEPMRRDWLHVLEVLGLGGLMFFYPLVSGLRPRMLLWCTLIPVLPPVFVFDGIVSVLRTYRPDELLALADSPACEDFEWEAGHWRYLGVFRGTYLMGHRKNAATSPA